MASKWPTDSEDSCKILATASEAMLCKFSRLTLKCFQQTNLKITIKQSMLSVIWSLRVQSQTRDELPLVLLMQLILILAPFHVICIGLWVPFETLLLEEVFDFWNMVLHNYLPLVCPRTFLHTQQKRCTEMSDWIFDEDKNKRVVVVANLTAYSSLSSAAKTRNHLCRAVWR